MIERLREELWPANDEHGADSVDSSVLVPLQSAGDGFEAVLTVRPQHLPEHPGQVVFPGGHLVPGETPLAAALREAYEEVRLPPEAVDVIGHLGDVTGPGGRTIRAHVGHVFEDDVEYVPDPQEVDRVFQVGLDVLSSEDVYEGRMIDPASDVPWSGYTVHIFHIEPRPVWGFTGGLIARLLELAMEWEPPSPPGVVTSPGELRAGLP